MLCRRYSMSVLPVSASCIESWDRIIVVYSSRLHQAILTSRDGGKFCIQSRATFCCWPCHMIYFRHHWYFDFGYIRGDLTSFLERRTEFMMVLRRLSVIRFSRDLDDLALFLQTLSHYHRCLLIPSESSP